MSQAKVERYKKEKVNRKKNVKEEKAKNLIVRTVGAVLCIALIGWIGYSVYSSWEASQPAKTTEITMDALSDYLDELSTEE